MKKQGEEESSTIDEQWQAAQLFMAKGPSATLEYVEEEVRARLSAYRSQGLDGPCLPWNDGTLFSDPALRMRQDAWMALGDMPKDEARKMFVDLLTSVSPDWRQWDDVHGRALRKAQQGEGGEAARLLKAFRDRTGLQLPSRL
ncbi:unnamed protein product [Calypogeia fissa]